MQRLGYHRFVAPGGDWGFSVANVLGAISVPAVQAVHFNMFPNSETMEASDAQEERVLKRLRAFEGNESGYRAAQVQSPQTIGYALTDSPVGHLRWVLMLMGKSSYFQQRRSFCLFFGFRPDQQP